MRPDKLEGSGGRSCLAADTRPNGGPKGGGKFRDAHTPRSNGFKNLVDFALDFGPYTCIAGANGVGKSNIFDAIRFLSLLTEHTMNDCRAAHSRYTIGARTPAT